MSQQATLGTNRTGIAAAPQRSQEMRTGMEEFPPTSEGSAQDIARVRISYAKEAEPLGSMPLPAGMKKKAKTATKTVMGAQPTLFLDKLNRASITAPATPFCFCTTQKYPEVKMSIISIA